MKRTIWQNYNFNVKDWKDDFIMEKDDNGELVEYLMDNGYSIDDDDVLEWARDLNDEYLDDERMNLNVKIGMPIIVIANLGMWDGVHTTYKIITSGNLADCLYSDCDLCEWYCDDEDFRFHGSHHDGHNNYLYRAISAENLEFLESAGISLTTESTIKHYTQSLRPYIANVYWG